MTAKRTWEFGFELKNKSRTSRLILGECGLNVIWKLAQEGKLSIYDLYRRKGISAGKVEYSTPEVEDDVVTSGKEDIGFKKKYFYSFLHKTVNTLEKRGLVRQSKDTSGIRNRKMVELTLLGLLVYLWGSNKEDKFITALESNGGVFPFYSLWISMIEQLGEDRVINALAKTTKDIQQTEVAVLRVQSHRIDGYLPCEEVTRQHKRRDKDAAEFLLREDSSTLRASYLAYLMLQDVRKLNKQKLESMNKSLPEPFSQTEVTFFESNGIPLGLTSTEEYQDFLKKHFTLESLFTGMFVENLLWQ
jgi:hypothetical protein